ncbi:putative NAD(+)--arginine ADP-ribosyltransferase Vis precursor [compost metagenome]
MNSFWRILSAPGLALGVAFSVTLTTFPTPASETALEGRTYLDSSTVESASLRYFESLFQNSQNLQYSTVAEEFSKSISDPGIEILSDRYSEDLFQALEIDDLLEWMSKHPDIVKGAYAYVNDPLDDSPQLWLTTNQKLRKGESLNQKEQKFVADLQLSMKLLPNYRGLVFRGGALRIASLRKYVSGALVLEPSFTSTSVAPEVALNFSAVAKSEDRLSVIFVIKVIKGTPVSIFHQDHWVEKEILLSPQQTFKVHHVLVDDTKKKAIVIMEQMPSN